MFLLLLLPIKIEWPYRYGSTVYTDPYNSDTLSAIIINRQYIDPRVGFTLRFFVLFVVGW